MAARGGRGRGRARPGDRAMRVLYVNHTSRVSGAERSLLELMTALRGDVEPVLACPEGDLSRRAEAAGLRTVRLHSLEVGFGSGPREMLRAGGRLVRAAARVASLSRRLEVDVVHAASTRAGIVAGCRGADRRAATGRRRAGLAPRRRSGRLSSAGRCASWRAHSCSTRNSPCGASAPPGPLKPWSPIPR